jgi:hypothetical protein
VVCIPSAFAAHAAVAATVDHTPWDTILKQYVDDGGKVAYRRLHDESGDALAGYLKTLAAARVDDLAEKDQLAFWINAYNALIVAGILDGYSPESAFGRYRFFRSYERELAGERRTPDDVEHKIIRARFKDARTHFAVVCGSTSCPVLRREAYVGDRLDAQLDDQGRRFLNDPSRNRIDLQTGSVALSAIFKWFKDDFTRNGRSLADFVVPYLDAEQVQLLRTKPPAFLDYDWTLNAQPGQRP